MGINRNKVLKAADKYTRQGKLDAAVGELLKLVKDNPKDMSTVNRVGDLYAKLGKTQEAVDQFTKIADHYNNDGFLLKSIAIYKKITKLDPTNADAYQSLARLYSQQGLTMEARAQFQMVAEHHTKEGNLEGALGSYREMLELDAGDLKVQLTTAELLERLERADEALEVYRAVGDDLDRRGMSKESRKVYEASLRLAPTDNNLVRRLVVSLRREKTSGEALQYLKGLLEERPSDAELLSLVGDAHLDHGDVDQAREFYDQVRKQAPDRMENHLNQARLSLKEDDPDACFVHLEEAIRAVEGQSREDLFIIYLSELLDTRPHHIAALKRLTDLHEAAGQEALCRDACIRLAGASLESGKLELAAQAMERLIKLDPDNPRHQERLQDVLAKIKRAGGTYPPADVEAVPSAGAVEPASDAAEEPGEAIEIEIDTPEEAVAPEVEAVAATETMPLTGAAEEPPPVGDMEQVLPTVEEEIDADFVAEHMTEAEVFVKYGLVDRALEQLNQVLERYANHLGAHEALLAIYLEEGDRARAGGEYRAIALIHGQAGDPEKAAKASSLADEMGPGVPAEPAAPEAQEAAPAAPEPPTAPEPQEVVADADVAELEEEAVDGDEIDLDSTTGAEAPPIESLEEVDALLEGGALEEARKRLLKLRAEFPERSEVEERLTRVGMLERQARPASAPRKEKEEVDFFDLAAELDESLFEAQTAVGAEEEPEAEGHSLEDLVEAFKKGVEEEVSSEDFETHYNLAIAYKEMGLVDEAIGEFQFASKSPDFFLKCCSMLGICFQEKGMAALAVKWYSKGLEAGNGDEHLLLGLRYDLALLYEESGDAARALELLTEIYGADAKYRDAAERMKALKEATAGS